MSLERAFAKELYFCCIQNLPEIVSTGLLVLLITITDLWTGAIGPVR